MKDFSYNNVKKEEIASLLANFLDGMNEISIQELTGNSEDCNYIYRVAMVCKRKY